MGVRQRTWTTRKGEERQAWICEYTDSKGKWRLKTFSTKKEATNFAAKTHTDVSEGKHVVESTSITVAEAAEEWIEAVRAGRNDRGPAEASTIRQCRYHVDRYIVPELGRIKLAKLTKARVVDFKDGLLKRVSRPLAKKVLTSLKGVLSEALHRERVAVNAAAAVKVGAGDRHHEDVRIPSVQDIKAILARLDELAGAPEARSWRRWRALIATAAHTGMRASEIRGLPWSAVDLKHGRISVVQKADENGTIGKPKSKASKRAINISPALIQILRSWKVEAGAGELVFGTSNGRPESLANVFNRAWVPVQLGAGIADQAGRDTDGRQILRARYNFHTLRHFHASMLIADNANPKEIQAEMGHSSIKVTYDLYGHLFHDEEADKARKARAARLAGRLG